MRKFAYPWVVLLFMLVPVACAQIETMDNYVITTQINSDGTAHITQEFDIKSHSPEPIIPGKAKLLFFENLEPENIAVYMGQARLRTTVGQEGDKTVVYYEIWQPLVEGESLHIKVDLDTTDPSKKGILFEQMGLRISNPSIPVRNLTFIVEAPENKRITFTTPEAKSINGNRAVVEHSGVNPLDNLEVEVEYTILPLPVLPFHGYWIWALLVVLALAVLLLVVYRSKKTVQVSGRKTRKATKKPFSKSGLGGI